VPGRSRPSGQARGQAPPRSKPVGLWLRSSQQGSRGLGSLVPSVTQTTHPSGPRQPVYAFLLRGRRSSGRSSVSLVSPFMALPFTDLETLPASRFATAGQGRRAPGLRSLWIVASKPWGAAGALARRTLAAAEAQAAALRLAFPVLVTFRIRLYRLGGIASGCSFDIVADAHRSVMPWNGCLVCH
jgi:hypothetical protein